LDRYGFGPRAAEPEEEVSRPGELRPRPLAEPCVNLSAHTAPSTQPHGRTRRQ
jgi:hypothetical protein